MKLVYLDPGHGGNKPGNVNGGVRESTTALKLGKRIAHYIRLLSKTGDINSAPSIQTAMSRDMDMNVSINKRAQMAVKAGADLMVSVHTNSSIIKSAHGAEVWVSAAGYYKLRSAAIATEILRHLEALGFSNRGVKPDIWYSLGRLGVLRGVDKHMPAVLIEPGFASNDRERKLLTDPDSQEIIAQQTASVIVKHFGIEPRWDLIL
jgi:N-acetylmuramoyl-L-alanine amidase